MCGSPSTAGGHVVVVMARDHATFNAGPMCTLYLAVSPSNSCGGRRVRIGTRTWWVWLRGQHRAGRPARTTVGRSETPSRLGHRRYRSSLKRLSPFLVGRHRPFFPSVEVSIPRSFENASDAHLFDVIRLARPPQEGHTGDQLSRRFEVSVSRGFVWSDVLVESTGDRSITIEGSRRALLIASRE